MELFREDGHLTLTGIKAVIGGEIDEMQRLEISEHLEFCEECMDSYLALLTDDVLLEPRRPVCEPAVKDYRKKNRRTTLLRYGNIAAAACLAVLMWGVGTFVFGGANAQGNNLHNNAPLPVVDIPVANEGFGIQIDGVLKDLFTVNLGSGANVQTGVLQQQAIEPPSPPEPEVTMPRRQPQSRQQLEDLFDQE